jgi:hypothetical protein
MALRLSTSSWLLLAALLTGCGAGQNPPEAPAAAISVVDVPEAPTGEKDPSAPPAAVRVERKDPLDYFVGTWDGVFTDERFPNGVWNTVLTIDGYGRFNVHFAPPHGAACEQSGDFRVGSGVVVLDTRSNTCNPERQGAMERPIVSKEEDVFVLRTPDALMTFRYTRRVSGPDEE